MRGSYESSIMGGPHRPFNIAVHTSKLDVDNRFPLKFYHRTAENLLKQANIYREEKNIIELFILLLRYSSLVGETIPEHQQYRTCSAKQKTEYRKKLNQVLTELELIKPEFQKRVDQINKAFTDNLSLHDLSSSDYERPSVKKGPIQNIDNGKIFLGHGSNGALQQSSYASTFSSSQLGDQLHNLSLHLPVPKEETLSRHSFLGPCGLRGQWQTPITQTRVQYPCYIDSSPIEVPSIEERWNKSSSSIGSSDPLTALDSEDSELNSWKESDARSFQGINRGVVDPPAIISQASLIRHPSPPLVAAQVQMLPVVAETAVQLPSWDVTDLHSVPAPSLEDVLTQNVGWKHLPLEPETTAHVPPWDVADPRSDPVASLEDGLTQSKGPKNLHISVQMMDDFLKLAKHNTNQNLETCGVLAGSLKKSVFYVTTLIIPKQQATSDSCQTMNEEEIYDCQEKRSLLPLGWIHTHPTQTCFMSSVDLHTHYSYQVMLPEAIAIVMAPTDASRKYGIFRLSDPGGVKVIQQCQLRGFHPHDEPPEGGPIYEHSAHVFMNPKLRFHVIDLR